ncbi:helix-turn-helix domain-containing protein [Streptomyces sp. Ncost-T10-10d]|uniref:helix-turn-helix domain-containing protein n=1 Tax=Streptomyces sp. Ncost-T10-10d TaxID=1839774 RepID=UPI00081EBE56|nr:helix-turn-helix domain-containing protein [Streptomyces sp. Ncost-T10-10d]SCF61984.1 Homeodomain-like domain-containing protein [Streptomyces sp. Ncost-T10-10d]
MKVRADIATLIRDGHTDESIAHRLGCNRATVARARQALRLPPADQLGRLYAEALPTGRVLSDKPTRAQTSPAQAAVNRQALLAALREPRKPMVEAA